MKMPRSDAKLGAAIAEVHPHPTVLVDRTRRIVFANAAARDRLGARAGMDLGSALGCAELGDGRCGTEKRCARCAVDRVVERALGGERTRRRAYLLRTGPGGEPADLHVLLSASALQRGGSAHAVLVLQDLNELLADPEVLSVCAGCGRIEEDAEWYPLARYLEVRLGLEAGDALCPTCAGRSKHP